jgi:hypothetical protein
MHTKGVFLVGFLVKLNYTKLTPFILLYSNIYLNFHPTFFSLRAKFRLVDVLRDGDRADEGVLGNRIEVGLFALDKEPVETVLFNKERRVRFEAAP